MKTKKIPFNIEKAKAGAKVVTRVGYPVRMSDFDVKNEDGYTLIGIIDVKGNEIPYSFKETGCRFETETSDYDLFIEEEVKTRRMTNQELSDWLRESLHEHREFKYKIGAVVSSMHNYSEDAADILVGDILIRRNHGEWEEPLIEE